MKVGILQLVIYCSSNCLILQLLIMEFCLFVSGVQGNPNNNRNRNDMNDEKGEKLE